MKETEPNYISLQEATKYCNYSQEYLSLRARQGRLKSVKFGRNWVTKKEWIQEYLKKVGEYNNFKTKKFVAPPENLPIERTEGRWSLILKPVPLVRFGFVVVLTFVLLVAGIFHNRESFKIVYQDIEPYTYIVGGAGDIIVENTIKVAADTISDIPQSFQYVNKEINSQLTIVAWDVASAGEVTADTFKEYGQWLGRVFGKVPRGLTLGYTNINNSIEEKLSKDLEELVIGTKYLKLSFKQGIIQIGRSLTRNYLMANNFIEQKLNQGYRAITQFWTPKKIVEEKLIPKLGEEGVVVIPSTEKDEEVKEKIKESFSDEVKVEPKDKTSGIIIPIFKEGEGQKYLYILVPVNSE